MYDVSHYAFNELIDLLSDHTTKYSRLLVDGNRGEDFVMHKNMIKLLQAEIESRKASNGADGSKDRTLIFQQEPRDLLGL